MKEKILQACKALVEDRKVRLQFSMDSNKGLLLSETKSSAGDKHETGRAMLHLEMEKAAQQFISINEMQQVLNQISIEKRASPISLGSLVFTNFQNFFISVSLGEIVIGTDKFFAVSPQSPIGQLLIGKVENEAFTLNQKTYKIKEIN